MTAACSPPPHPHRTDIGGPLRRLEDLRLLTGRGATATISTSRAKSTPSWRDRLTRMHA